MCIGCTVMGQSKSENTLVSLNKVKSLRLSEQGLKVAKAKASYYLTVKEESVYPAKGFALYTAKAPNGSLLIVPLAAANNLGRLVKMPMPQWSLVTSNDELMIVCSCGTNISNQEGDNCVYDRATKVCSGNCTGDQSSKTCSITTMSMTSGKIIYNHNGG